MVAPVGQDGIHDSYQEQDGGSRNDELHRQLPDTCGLRRSRI